MLTALYIISKGGIPLHIYNPTVSISDDNDHAAILFSGIISAIQNFLIEINIGEARSFTTATHNINIFSRDNYACVVINELDDEYSEKQIASLFDSVTVEVDLILKDFDQAKVVNTPEVDGLLGMAISRIVSIWKKENSESKASKKLKNSLW
ncbi:MAG: hypothetical protein ACXAD7_14360 [Candidatus Kariarchaeaceae archaeon]|jgi:hypothetical protein